MKKYKDECDDCHKYAHCRGYKGRLLCESCIAKGYGELAVTIEEKKTKKDIFAQFKFEL